MSLASAGTALADDWDAATDQDDDVGTDNNLRSGSFEEHDLAAQAAAADVDFFQVFNDGLSSYEIVIETTGDLDLATADVQRLDQAGTTVLQGAAVNSGSAVLNWQNESESIANQRVRIQGAACDTACTADDSYTIEMRNTTYVIPRFRNSKKQTTVVYLQSMRAQASCAYTLHFLDDEGTLIGTHSAVVNQTTPEIVDTSDLPFAEKAQGSITLTNVCEYGSIAGKATTIEPAKGLSFDTALVPRIAP